MRVLLVEDNADAAETLADVLRLEGHEVEVAADGRSGIACARARVPDVVLCDLGLPGMDGYELAAKLKQQTNTKDALRIAVSGFKRRKHALAAAFDHYFNKPVDLPELLALLDRH